MKSWHTRHPEKAIEDRSVLEEVIAQAKYLTLALCAGNQPYLVTVNYAYDAARECFYFHCAGEGRKLDLIRANPRVYGQVLQDLGYLPGQCDHAYRTVQFDGMAELVEEAGEKLRALESLVEHLEPDPGPVKTRLARPERLAGVTVVRVRVSGWSGKGNG